MNDCNVGHVEDEERNHLGCQQHFLYILPCHQMEKYSKVPKHKVTNYVLHNPDPIRCPFPIEVLVFKPHCIKFLTDPEIKHPVHESNVIARVESMPESTHHDSPLLCSSLYLLPCFFVFVGYMWLINILIYVSFKSYLHTHIPRVSFYFEAGIKEKWNDVGGLNFFEILLFFRIAKARSMHRDHSQTPGSNVFELNM